MNRLKTLRLLALTLVILTALTPLLAAGAKRGWTKIELSHADGKSASIPPGLLQRFGAELIADYGAYSIAYVPKGALIALDAQAKNENIRLRVRDELDLLHLPGAQIDAREGIGAVPAHKLARAYPAGKPGAFVVQFVAPLRAEWMDGLQQLGWTLSRYIPNDGYLLVGAPELAARTRELPYVQYLDFYHPYQKATDLDELGAADDLVFVLPAGAASETAVEEIRAVSQGRFRVERGSLDTYVYARVASADAAELLRHELILSATRTGQDEPADERQVHSLSPLLNAAQTQPVPGDYWSWVLSQCADCANMPAASWKIGIADSGLDNGFNAGGHSDLAGRKFFGALGFDTALFANDCTPSQPLCDVYQHGSLVAGIAAGSGASGIRDSGNYLMGLGGAPTAGMFMTKSFTSTSSLSFTNANLFLWTRDAANNDVTIQNHSWQNNSFNGRYTELSRRIDIAARDADDAATANRKPLLMTFAAGNDFQASGLETSPAGMAKNVLTVGGLENFRPEANSLLCGDGQGGSFTLADSFRNIMRASRVGTNLAGYVKPDVMAPASMILSTQTSMLWPGTGYCLRNYEGQAMYSGHSGTSFAAPLGAAASLIVKRYLGATAAATSPALTKAVLVAGARSVRGGEDRTKTPTQLIGPIPSQQQGFGRLTLEDILKGPAKPTVFDQSFTFTAPGQSFATSVRVRDASQPVKIALVWTDAPAMENALNPLVNDLNLEVVRSSDPTRVHIGNKLAVAVEAKGEESIAFSLGSLPYDNVNNVEFFRLYLNPNEDLNITVKAWNIAGDTDGNTATFEQDFALAILNAGPICNLATIVQHPQSTTIQPGQSAALSVIAGGTGPFEYQWFRGASGNTTTPICTNSPNCTVSPLTTTDYWVRVRGACSANWTDSNTATVTVGCTSAPVISSQPANVTTDPNQQTTLSVTASQAVSYQWYQGTAPSTATPVGTNSNQLTVAPSSTTSYWVRITNTCGSTNSNTATVCVRPGISVQPTNRTINQGQQTTFSVTAVNAVSYQWYQGTAPSTATPVGTNSNQLTVAPPVTTSYWVRVTNACGFVNSVTATVTVIPPNITRVRSAFALANSQTSITANWGGATGAGNLLVAVISGRKDPNGIIVWTPPAGWQLAVSSDWTNIITSIYYLPNNAGGRTSETFTVAQGFHDMTLYLMEYSGIMTVNPLDRTALAGDGTNDGNVWTGFTANTVQPKELVITALTTYTPTEFTVHPLTATELYDKFIGNRLTTAAYERINTFVQSCGHNAQVLSPGFQWVGAVATFKGANTN